MAVVVELPSLNTLYASEDGERDDRSGSTLFRTARMSRGDFLTIFCISPIKMMGITSRDNRKTDTLFTQGAG
jgi:hypothetical protein